MENNLEVVVTCVTLARSGLYLKVKPLLEEMSKRFPEIDKKDLEKYCRETMLKMVDR